MVLNPNSNFPVDVPTGHVPMVVTYLEMIERPNVTEHRSVLALEPWSSPPPDEYLSLFRKIGEPWLWASRLMMDEQTLCSHIHDPDVEIHIVKREADRVGLLELDFRETGQCEIAFFGLVPEMAGGGHGRWLMAEALRKAWRGGIKRVWLHTCTADSPRALPFYLRSGFTAYKREFDTMVDPRLSGHLSPEAAPHVPLIS